MDTHRLGGPGGSVFMQVGGDGRLPVTHRTLRISPAERFDVVVDFSRTRSARSSCCATPRPRGARAR
jgi:FtsP/CotA-like multicopper oxidase with cupredoxin domain